MHEDFMFAVVTAHDYLRSYRIDIIIICKWANSTKNVTKIAS